MPVLSTDCNYSPQRLALIKILSSNVCRHDEHARLFLLQPSLQETTTNNKCWFRREISHFRARAVPIINWSRVTTYCFHRAQLLLLHKQSQKLLARLPVGQEVGWLLVNKPHPVTGQEETWGLPSPLRTNYSKKKSIRVLLLVVVLLVVVFKIQVP